jgi:hypothetical protein
MNPRYAFATLGLCALLLAGCDTTQGPSPSLDTQPVTSTGAKRIEPAPESKSFADKKDVFQGAEYDPGTGAVPAGARQIRMNVGQVMEVFRGSRAIGDGQYELSFYLPVEARSVVQLVVETKGLTKTYFLRAIGEGDTVGGVVQRRWLDSSGYNPLDTASEARIQDAVRKAPYLISVQPR